MGDAFALEVQHFAGLGPGRDRNGFFAVDGRDGDEGAQGDLRHVDAHVEQDVIAAAAEILVRPDVDDDVQVPVRAAVHPRLSSPCRGARSPLVDAGGDGDAPLHRLAQQPAPAAGPAGRGDRLAGAAAGGTGRDIDHRPQERVAHVADFTGAVAGGAADGRRAGLGAAAVAGGTDFLPRELDRLFDSGDGLQEFERQVVAQIGPAARRPPVSPSPGAESEKLLEDVGEAEAEVGGHTLNAGMAETVIRGAPLLVGKDGVGLVDLLEALLRAVVLVDVGVELLGQAPISATKLVRRGAPADFEDFVVVALGGHSIYAVSGREDSDLTPYPLSADRARRRVDAWRRGGGGLWRVGGAELPPPSLSQSPPPQEWS